MIFLRFLSKLISFVFWAIAGVLALGIVTGVMSLLPPAGPFAGPFGGLLLLLIIAKSARRIRRQRGAMVLNYLSQAVRLNLPIPPMLAAARAGERNALGRRLDALRVSLEEGRSLGTSLGMDVPELSERTVGLVAAAERVGRLTPALDRLVQEERRAARAYSYGPMLGWSYGLVLILFLLFLLSGIALFIMPMFIEIFEDFEVALPWQTRVTFDWAGGMGAPAFIIIVGLIALTAGWALYESLHGIDGVTPSRWRFIDRIVWLTPFYRGVARDRGLSDACRVIAESLEAGDTLESAVNCAAQVRMNQVWQRRVQAFADELLAGRTLRDAAENAKLPKLMTGMLATGQACSDPMRVFDFLARYYAGRFSRTVTLIQSASVPLVVMVLAVIVGWVVYSLMVPLAVLINDATLKVWDF